MYFDHVAVHWSNVNSKNYWLHGVSSSASIPSLLLLIITNNTKKRSSHQFVYNENTFFFYIRIALKIHDHVAYAMINFNHRVHDKYIILRFLSYSKLKKNTQKYRRRSDLICKRHSVGVALPVSSCITCNVFQSCTKINNNKILYWSAFNTVPIWFELIQFCRNNFVFRNTHKWIANFYFNRIALACHRW